MKRKTASKVFFVSIRGKAPLAHVAKSTNNAKKKSYATIDKTSQKGNLTKIPRVRTEVIR